MMRSYWFGDVYAGGCTRAEGGLDALVERLNSIKVTPGDIIPPDWRMARECGAVKDRADTLAPVIAYTSETLGTRIGADLLNLDRIRDLGAPMVSIGGAGTFDGIFLAGVIAAFLA